LVVIPQDLKPGNLAVNQDCELKVLNQLGLWCNINEECLQQLSSKAGVFNVRLQILVPSKILKCV